MTRLVGLTGAARSGKDTVARFLEAGFSGPVELVGFADLVKLSAARALGVLSHPDAVGISAVRLWADRFKLEQRVQVVGSGGDVVHELSGRSFLQRYGTEAHRDLFGSDFWIEMQRFEPAPGGLLVFTDVRFPNEAEAIRAAGGEIWRVVRDVEPVDVHPSEVRLPDSLVDRCLFNRSSLAVLEDQARAALAGLEARG